MRFLFFVCAAAILMALPVRAQEVAPPPAHVAFVEGLVTIDHDGESEPAAVNMLVLEGDRVRTQNGRVAIMFPDGSAIEIDPYSDVELLAGTRVRVLAGAIEHQPAPPVDPRSASTQYLPQDLQTYGSTFDQNGSWQYESPYGYVWYPAVAADWRPYYYGYWSPVRRYGLTWIGMDSWSWPTHHYGRWGYGRSHWYWIPGRTWASAWVSWGTAPDYVSWCPLGYDGRPVVALSLGYRSAWDAWTIVPRARFGVGRYAAHRYAVEPQRLPSNTPFMVHRAPPSTTPGRVIAVGPARGDNGSVGVAVPRYEQRGQGAYRSPDRDGRDSNRDTSGSAVGRREPNADRRGMRGDVGVVTPIQPPAYDQRPGANDRGRTTDDQRRTTGDQRPTTNDHPAYRPNYAPTYAPSYDPSPRDRQPHAAGDGAGGAVDRRPAYQRPDRSGGNDAPRPSGGDTSGRAERRGAPREAGPSSPPPQPAPSNAPSNGPASAAGVRGAQRDGGGASPARAPQGDGGGRSQGTAVRRPR